METANQPGRAWTFSSNDSHVVDWQLLGTADTQRREVHEHIKELESRAMRLLRAAMTNPGAAAAQRSLAALEAEIARLRSDLAWRKAETRAPRGGS
jgi:hypothetical protein